MWSGSDFLCCVVQPAIPPCWTQHVQRWGGVFWWCPPDALHTIYGGLAKQTVQRCVTVLLQSRKVRTQAIARSMVLPWIDQFARLGAFSAGVHFGKVRKLHIDPSGAANNHPCTGCRRLKACFPWQCSTPGLKNVSADGGYFDGYQPLPWWTVYGSPRC